MIKRRSNDTHCDRLKAKEEVFSFSHTVTQFASSKPGLIRRYRRAGNAHILFVNKTDRL